MADETVAAAPNRRRYRNDEYYDGGPRRTTRGYYAADGFLDLAYSTHRLHREMAASFLEAFSRTLRYSYGPRDGYYYGRYDSQVVGESLSDLSDTIDDAADSFHERSSEPPPTRRTVRTARNAE